MFQFLRSLIQPYRRTLGVIFFAMLVEAGTSLAAPWPLKLILDSVVKSRSRPSAVSQYLFVHFAHGSTVHFAAVSAVLFVLIAVIGSAASYVDSYYTESVGQWVAYDLRLRVYSHLQRLSLGYYNTHETGAILSTLTTDIQTIQGFASSQTLNILIDFLTIICMLGLMFWLNWDFTLIALAVTPFLLLFVSRFKTAVKAATHEVRKQQSEIVSVAQEGLQSIQVVEAFGQEKAEERALAAVSHAAVNAALKARGVKALLSPVVSITVAVCTATVLWRGASLIVAGSMSVGSLTVYLAYLSRFFKPVKDLATTTNAIAQVSVGTERVRALLDADGYIPDDPAGIKAESLLGDIELRNVAFSYDTGTQILTDVSVQIKAGEFVGIVGTTGSGKSTMMTLVPRFYDVTSGELLVDGRDVRAYKLSSLRDQIGYVMQETILFRGTIADNIAFGRPDATRADVIEAAALANADEFIRNMPLGYDTMVGERGATLSGGQRQRIGIARVMIRKNPILLLDEPTAALDSESEALVIAGLETLMHGKTVIAIAHRLSTIRKADLILVLHEGSIAESGTHEQLMAMNGIYAGLYQIQFNTEPGTQ
jgi:ABC-type multidrug transport system fused ATPase/permease subunit